MQPDIVTFWHGPLDALRRTCLRSQVAAGHNVTVYSFDPIADLPDGVGNAEAEPILPHAFSEKLRPPQSDGIMARLDHAAVQRFLPDAADGAKAPACGSTPTCCCSSPSISILQNPISPGSGGARSAIPCSICRRATPSSPRSRR